MIKIRIKPYTKLYKMKLQEKQARFNKNLFLNLYYSLKQLKMY